MLVSELNIRWRYYICDDKFYFLILKLSMKLWLYKLNIGIFIHKFRSLWMKMIFVVKKGNTKYNYSFKNCMTYGFSRTAVKESMGTFPFAEKREDSPESGREREWPTPNQRLLSQPITCIWSNVSENCMMNKKKWDKERVLGRPIGSANVNNKLKPN